jgi:hypothetical protein
MRNILKWVYIGIYLSDRIHELESLQSIREYVPHETEDMPEYCQSAGEDHRVLSSDRVVR